MTNLVEIKKEINAQLADKEVLNAVLATTFKGLSQDKAREALMEGMLRGHSFQDFLKKNVYAVPFGGGYSLVTSIDHARKIGMKSGVVGVSKPEYEIDEERKEIISCTITVKRRVGEDIGEFTATVYFNEYNTGKNQWQMKPRTMIAKVAEMHALRKACPEELSQNYTEEEFQGESRTTVKAFDLTPYKEKIEAVSSLDELRTVWSSLPSEAKTALEEAKNTLKEKFTKNENAQV